MIHEFLDSWALFHNAYLAGWLIAAALAMVGVIAVARDQVFAGAAMSQASTLGIALAMWAGVWLTRVVGAWAESDGFLTLMAVVFSVGAAALMARAGGPGRESREAVTGWIFLLSASAAILALTRSPHGLEEVHRLVSSSIIGATRADVLLFSAMALVSALTLLIWRGPLLLWVMDPPTAAACGVRTRLVEIGVALWLGVSVGLAIRSSGLLFTFGCLVLPALVAKNVCREVRAMLLAAPLAGVGAAVAGFVVANWADMPPGQVAVAALCGMVAASWVFRRVRGLA